MLLHAIAPKDDIIALHWACYRGDLHLLKRLLPVFPINLENEEGVIAVHAAASEHHPIILEYLLLHGGAVNHADYLGFTALHRACDVGNSVSEDVVLPVVQLLIEHDADVNAQSINPNGPPLLLALISHFFRVCRLFHDAGADPNATADDGSPLVTILTHLRDQAGLEFLLTHGGADVNAFNSDGSNSLLMASERGPVELVKLFVEHGVTLGCSDADGNTPLILALVAGCIDIAESLVGLEGVDTVSQNRSGLTPVSLALEGAFQISVDLQGSSDVVFMKLLERGADVNQTSGRGLTMLHKAVLMDKMEMVKMMLGRGADLEIGDIDGATALLSAIRMKSLPMTKILVEGGANKVRSGPAGLSPLLVASEVGFVEALSLLM